MKKLILICAIGAGILFAPKANAQGTLSDEEYSFITMELQGILNLTLTTDPQVDFKFKTIQDYQNGIMKFNAAKLEVDATVAWDLKVFANSADWVPVDAYSTNGEDQLPCEILGIRSDFDNGALDGSTEGTGITKTFQSLTSDVAVGTRQFIAGGTGVRAALTTNLGMLPGSAIKNPTTNKYRLDYALVPGVPASFAKVGDDVDRLGAAASSIDPTAGEYAMPGYYYLEIVYELTEDI